MSSPSPARPSERIGGVYIVPLRAFSDDRGYFFESFRKAWIPGVREMVQGNVSFSKASVLRGMHYHLKQADFWLVPSGRVRAAAWLLDQAGFHKGFALGEAGISSRHTLALINRGQATCADIRRLRDRIVAEVRQRFGVELEQEPVYLS